MLTDIEIAQKAKLHRIQEIAASLDIPEDAIDPYGKYKAKISLEYLHRLSKKPKGKLVLVTAISPTPPGEGKTTTTVGLGDALKRIGKKTVICLREPSLGPVFGMKGGAAGGGHSQVVPMEDINLHFTGDFSAIQLANNLLAAMIDNHIHYGNELGFDVRQIKWRRVLDMNDRALRKIVVALGGHSGGVPREDHFDIVVASEIMAVFCLSKSLSDLKERLGRIVVGYRSDETPIYARDLKAEGAMTILLKDALKPNLVQTMENTPAIIHGGPFANIAHGCNSVIATEAGLGLADFVVTEAGFGADLGAQKFFDIKCRQSGLVPDAAVLVATVRALKYHGGAKLKELEKENLAALDKGLCNLEKHIHNIQHHYGVPVVVAINHFSADSDAEVKSLLDKSTHWEVPVVLSKHWLKGGAGAEDLALAVVDTIQSRPTKFTPLYENEMPLLEKVKTTAIKIYGASDVHADKAVLKQIKFYQDSGYGHLPVCVAKTQYSFSTDAKLRGAPTGHTINIREVRLSAGAGFIVMVCGDIMTMPGLPKEPAAIDMTIDDHGRITGLS